MGKIHIVLNSSERLEQILQETYDMNKAQIKQAQDEISKLQNSSPLKDGTWDEKDKYYKAIKSLLDVKDKAIAQIKDICKIMQEVCKSQGDLSKVVNSENINSGGFSGFDEVRKMVEIESAAKKDEIYKL